VFLHQKIIGNSSDTRLLERTSIEPALRPAVTAQQLHRAGGSGITAASVAPSGKHIALACRDGALRVLEIPSGTLICGFKAYYGGLLCCSWSSDGKLIAAGGEDDLVAVYNFEKRQLVAHLQGHTSWVSGVAFDPWAPSLDAETTSAASSVEGGRYRLASVGQDCQGILWEVGAGLLESGANNNNRDSSIGGVVMGNNDNHGAVDDGMDIDGVDVNGNNPYGTSSGGGFGGGGGGDIHRNNSVIAPALPRSEMTFLDPLAQLKMHIEPLCDVVFEPNAMLVSSNDGSVKKFVRPQNAGAGAEPAAGG
jgi:WD domain, G-beta repeat